MNDIEQIMRTSAVIPVLVIDDAADAAPLAEALVRGGLRVLEVTMRTPAALDARSAINNPEPIAPEASASQAPAGSTSEEEL